MQTIVLFAKQKIAYKLESNFGRLFQQINESNRFVKKSFIMLQKIEVIFHNNIILYLLIIAKYLKSW